MLTHLEWCILIKCIAQLELHLRGLVDWCFNQDDIVWLWFASLKHQVEAPSDADEGTEQRRRKRMRRLGFRD